MPQNMYFECWVLAKDELYGHPPRCEVRRLLLKVEALSASPLSSANGFSGILEAPYSNIYAVRARAPVQ
jgi:hypothetical protein